MGLVALVRVPDESLTRCELTHVSREPIDFAAALEEHAAYCGALSSLGVEVVELPALVGAADGVFVEDLAIVLPEIAIVARPGAASRRHETEGLGTVLGQYRSVVRELAAPATLDGGDVLCVGKRVFVGCSSRTNDEGVEQLRGMLQPFGYEVTVVQLAQCLHLKTAVCLLPNDAVLLNPDWIDPAIFVGLDVVQVDEAEPFGANALWVAGRAVYPKHHPRTAAKLRGLGIDLVEVSQQELAKAESGVTCLSVVFSREE